MSWECNECGGVVQVVETRVYSNTYNIDSEGKTKGRAIYKDTIGEHIGSNYSCKKCGAYYGTETAIEDIATRKQK